MTKRALCLANPNAKAGDADLEAVRLALADAGIEMRLERPASEEEARSLIRDAGPEVEMLIVGGGDGTISHLVGDLIAADKPIGILPMGTANDFARSLEIPVDLAAAARLIAAGRTRKVDVGTINGRPFVNVASLGFGADIAQYHKGPRKKWLGVLAYPLSWWDAWRSGRPFQARLKVDGENRRVRCMQLAVGSGRHYGGGMTIDEQASHADGLLRIYYVAPVGLADWLGLLPALRRGRLRQSPHVETTWGREVEIEVLTRPRRRRVNVDGDLVERAPARFGIEPGALTVFAPPQGVVPGVETVIHQPEGVMSILRDDTVTALNTLIAACLDAAEAARGAAEALDDKVLASRLLDLAESREKVAEALKQEVISRDDLPVGEADEERLLVEQAFTGIKASLAETPEKTWLEYCQEYEAALRDAADSALRRDDLGGDQRRLIERLREDAASSAAGRLPQVEPQRS